FFSSRRRHTRFKCDWSSDVCSSDLFSWPCPRELKTIRVGYIEGTSRERDLKVLKGIGVKLVPIKLPSKYLFNELTTILYVEAARSEERRVGKERRGRRGGGS